MATIEHVTRNAQFANNGPGRVSLGQEGDTTKRTGDTGFAPDDTRVKRLEGDQQPFTRMFLIRHC